MTLADLFVIRILNIFAQSQKQNIHNIMTRITYLILATIFTIGGVSAQDRVLMKINNKPVYKSDFEYLYHKNNTDGAIDKKSLKEYADLFVNFRLKVEEAQAQGLDTVSSFVREYQNYKSQLAQPYLEDTVSSRQVARMIYDRLGNNVEVSHILVKFQGDRVFPADTLAAYNKALKIRERLTKKKPEKFEDVAFEVSEDPGAKMGAKAGYLGWVTSMLFVAPFEDAMYSMKSGEISMPVRSRFGYHIIKVHNVQPNPGDVNVAHIMFGYGQLRPQEKPSKAVLDSVNAVAQSVYQRLLAGEDFNALCKEFSSDKGSAQRNGDLGWVSMTSRFPQEFKDESFALKNAGDISKPFTTDFGFHIAKLLGKKDPETWAQSEAKLKNQIRSTDLYPKVLALEDIKLKKILDAKLNQTEYNKLLALASTAYPTDSAFLSAIQGNTALLLTVGDKAFTVDDLANYITSSPAAMSPVSTELLTDFVDNFTRQQLKDIENANLDKKYPEYARLSSEYHDGILLFDVMNKEVWEKASTDTLGLENQFAKNKAKYAWATPKYKGMIVHAKDQSALDKVAKFAKKEKDTDKLLELLKAEAKTDSTLLIRVERGIWAQGENTYVDNYIYKQNVEVKENIAYPLFSVYGKMMKAPASYLDVKGLVVADYQDLLEKEWLSALRAKYPVEIDEAVLETVK